MPLDEFHQAISKLFYDIAMHVKLENLERNCLPRAIIMIIESSEWHSKSKNQYKRGDFDRKALEMRYTLMQELSSKKVVHSSEKMAILFLARALAVYKKTESVDIDSVRRAFGVYEATLHLLYSLYEPTRAETFMNPTTIPPLSPEIKIFDEYASRFELKPEEKTSEEMLMRVLAFALYLCATDSYITELKKEATNHVLEALEESVKKGEISESEYESMAKILSKKVDEIEQELEGLNEKVSLKDKAIFKKVQDIIDDSLNKSSSAIYTRIKEKFSKDAKDIAKITYERDLWKDRCVKLNGIEKKLMAYKLLMSVLILIVDYFLVLHFQVTYGLAGNSLLALIGIVSGATIALIIAIAKT
jgi:hypothetical protein